MKFNFHDCKIFDIKELRGHLIIKLDALFAPWTSNGLYELVCYNGVLNHKGKTIIGDDWLFMEMHLSNVKQFEIHILCGKSEFEIAADRIEVKIK